MAVGVVRETPIPFRMAARILDWIGAKHSSSTATAGRAYFMAASDPLKTPLSPDSCQSLSHFLKAIPLFYRRLLLHHTQIAFDEEIWHAFRSKR